MYPEKKGGSHKMARPQQNWGLLTLLTRRASIWTMPNTASPKSEPPCGRAIYTPVRATILGHPPQKTAPGGIIMGSNPVYFPCAKVKLDLFKLLLFIQNGILLLCYVYNAQDATYKWRNSNVIITANVIAMLFWRNGGVIVTLCVRRGRYTEPQYHNV